ncbi:hypothetical protein ACNKHM_09975 [Shigella sonnei]
MNKSDGARCHTSFSGQCGRRAKRSRRAPADQLAGDYHVPDFRPPDARHHLLGSKRLALRSDHDTAGAATLPVSRTGWRLPVVSCRPRRPGIPALVYTSGYDGRSLARLPAWLAHHSVPDC